MQTRFVMRLILFVDDRLTGSTKILVIGLAVTLVPFDGSVSATVFAELKGTESDSGSAVKCGVDDGRDVADDGTGVNDSDASDVSNTGSDFITVKSVSSVSAGT